MDKVQETVDRLKGIGVRVRVRNRKLVGRTKVYLQLRGEGTHSDFFRIVKPAIKENWPDAYMTSGGFSCAGVPNRDFDCTVALEK